MQGSNLRPLPCQGCNFNGKDWRIRVVIARGDKLVTGQRVSVPFKLETTLPNSTPWELTNPVGLALWARENDNLHVRSSDRGPLDC